MTKKTEILKTKTFSTLAIIFASILANFTASAKVEKYTNPIVNADYSDPDIVESVDGKGYYMTASSFVSTPALPILYSEDLVNWEIVNHAIPSLQPHDWFDGAPKHGKGVWAPSIRHHNGVYYIVWGDPDLGVFMLTTSDPRGNWSDPMLIIPGQGLIDACPLWDEDGKAYMVNAWAGSRAHFNSVLTIREMTPNLTRAIGAPVLVYDGNVEGNHTTEGPKLYKRDGKYYIMAPAGGVAQGWQLALRSDNIYGPYESKIVMAQGETDINGPHQGGMVQSPNGESWFINFQDKGWLGRVLHLNPVKWVDGWPVMGIDPDGDKCGEPVRTYPMPINSTKQIKEDSYKDSFSGTSFPKKWQWSGNYEQSFGFPSTAGYARIYGWEREQDENLWVIPNLLLQKCPSEEFTVTAHLKFTVKSSTHQAMAGLVMFGLDYAGIGVQKKEGAFSIVTFECYDAEHGHKENIQEVSPIKNPKQYEAGAFPNTEVQLWLRGKVEKGHKCTFYWSENGKEFHKADHKPFTLKEGKWVGARTGVFAVNPSGKDRCWIDLIDFSVDDIK